MKIVKPKVGTEMWVMRNKEFGGLVRSPTTKKHAHSCVLDSSNSRRRLAKSTATSKVCTSRNLHTGLLFSIKLVCVSAARLSPGKHIPTQSYAGREQQDAQELIM